jgi:hypothetical protein
VEKKKDDEKKLEDIFLAYANYDFEESPEALGLIFELIDCAKIFSLRTTRFVLRKPLSIYPIVDNIINLSFCESPRDSQIEKIKPNHPEKNDVSQNQQLILDYSIASDFFNAALNAVFPLSGCAECKFNEIKTSLGENGKTKCFVCVQRCFIYILTEIVKGIKYDSILGFIELYNTIMNDFPKYELVFSIPPLTSKIKAENILTTSYDENIERGLEFNEYLFWIVIFCLTIYLYNNGRDKLKQCPECKKYFIASKLDERIRKCSDCSFRSKKTKEYNREYQKKRRAKLRLQAEVAKKKAYIKRLTERGVSLKDAEELWGFDKNERERKPIKLSNL